MGHSLGNPMNRQERIEKILIDELSNREIEGNIERTAAALVKLVVFKDELEIDFCKVQEKLCKVCADGTNCGISCVERNSGTYCNFVGEQASAITPDIIKFKGDEE